jgi:hypothetical protein
MEQGSRAGDRVWHAQVMPCSCGRTRQCEAGSGAHRRWAVRSERLSTQEKMEERRCGDVTLRLAQVTRGVLHLRPLAGASMVFECCADNGADVGKPRDHGMEQGLEPQDQSREVQARADAVHCALRL